MLKRILKLAISALVYAGDLLTNSITRLLGRPPRPRAVVLYYHGISDSERPGFERQMNWLARHAVPLDCSRPLLNGNPRYAAVTFDDGYVSVVENALPVLRKRQIPAAIFVPSACLGAPPPWVRSSRLKSRNETIVNPEQLRALSLDPLITIGSHTRTHPQLAELSPGEAARQLHDSKAELESILARPVSIFSFPHGSFSARDLQLAREAGYTRVFGIHPALAFQHKDEFITGRVSADPADWKIEFLLKLAGAYRWLSPSAAHTA